MALVALAACQKKQQGRSDDLAADLSRAAGDQMEGDLALAARGGPGTAVVSAQEQIAPHYHVARSRRSTPHLAMHRSPKSPDKAVVATTVATTMVPTAGPPETPTPVAETPRPTPVAVSYPDPANAGNGGSGDMGRGGSGNGDGGGIGIVIIRGGVGRGDHCDPRTDRGAGVHISIGRNFPVIRF